MCSKRKQPVNYLLVAIVIMVLMHCADLLVSSAQAQTGQPSAEIGGVALGENLGGVLDRVFVAAPPNWQFTVALTPGSFLDCGSGMAVAQTADDGRDVFPVSCGVTLTETLVIPSASRPAQLIIHY